jgi:hypothetical protein
VYEKPARSSPISMEYAPASKAPRGSQETSLPPLEPHRWLQSSIWFHLIEFASSINGEREPLGTLKLTRFHSEFYGQLLKSGSHCLRAFSQAGEFRCMQPTPCK